jgi:hypothetical protein
MQTRALILTAGLFLVAVSPVVAVADETTDQLWLDYHNHVYLNLHWELQGELGYRTEVDPASKKTVYARPAMRWHPMWKPVELRFGVGAFYTFNRLASDVFEIRPWGGAVLKWPRIGRLTVVSQVRVEDRLQWATEDWTLEDVWRIRYMLSTKVPLSRDQGERYFFVPVSAEGFSDAGSRPVGQLTEKFRIDAGVGLVFGWEWVAELHFIVQESRSGGTGAFDSTDLIVRVEFLRLAAQDYMKTH